MKAGCEMDVLVANKVMGWELGKDFWIVNIMRKAFVTLDPIESDDFRPWRPSESIEDAWEVLPTWPWAIDRMSHASRATVGYKGVDYSELGDTAPHAICLAALKALEAKESE